jgi:4'-phosphopantetheinyl transferase
MLQMLHSSADFPRLSSGEVHVWCVPLSSSIGNTETLGVLLYQSHPWNSPLRSQPIDGSHCSPLPWDSPSGPRSARPNPFLTDLSVDEREKAGRFVFERDRVRYIAARGILRRLLGGYLNIDPSEIRFSYGAFGKPELTGRLAGRLRFNLSHAGGWVACAVSGDRDVGIDIEPLQNDVPWQELASRVFSPNEQVEFGEIAPSEKAAAFLRGWTRKEAYLKGRGEGLSLSLDAFDIPFRSLEHGDSVRIRNASGRSSGWRLYPLDPIPGFASALAVEGAPARLTVCGWAEWPAAIKPATAVRFRESDSIEFPCTAGNDRGNAGSEATDLHDCLEGVWPI